MGTGDVAVSVQGEGESGMSVDALDNSDLELETRCPGPWIDRAKGTMANCSRGRIYNKAVPDITFDKAEEHEGKQYPYATCPVCNGTGKVLTDLGARVLDLVERRFRVDRYIIPR